MAISIYDTRTMLQAIELMKPTQTFLRNTFFPGTLTFLTEKVDVDFRKGKRKMAPFVARNSGGITMDRQGYSTYSYEAPFIAPKRVLTKNDINKRMLGENLYSTRTPEQRAQELLAKDMIELNDMIVRREEWMVREILLNGAVTIKGYIDKIDDANYVEDTVDYNLTNKETLSGTDAWDQSTCDIYGDLKRIRLDIIQKTGLNPNVVIMASNVADLIIQDAEIQKMFNLWNMKFGTIQPQIQAEGVTFIGAITSLGLQLYTYDEWFIDDDGTEKAMIPDDYLIMGRANIGTCLYGAITQIEEFDQDFHTYEAIRVPKVWIESKDDKKMIRLSSRPLPKPDDVDSWYVLKVK